MKNNTSRKGGISQNDNEGGETQCNNARQGKWNRSREGSCTAVAIGIVIAVVVATASWCLGVRIIGVSDSVVKVTDDLRTMLGQ